MFYEDIDLSQEQFYEKLQAGGDIKTSMPLVGDVTDKWDELLKEYDEVVYKTNIENASIVPCTQLLENPSPLLEDIRFRELLDKLATEYRFVIIDTPPLGSVSDGALIASMCDGALLVIRAGSVPKTIIRQSLHEIDQAGCKLLGTVLNCVEGAGGRYGKYGHYGKYGKYGHYGQYGYGPQAEEENKKSRK